MKLPARQWPIALSLVVAGLTLGFSTTLPAPDPPQAQRTATSINGSAASEPVPAGDLETGKALFQRHCAQCHGDVGNGAGIAAAFLYPKPRNFQEGKFKLVSTLNRIPTDADLMQAITRGMPGSSMISFGHLPEKDRAALVAYVRHLTRAGIAARLKKSYEDAGDEIDAAQLEKEVARQTTPGEVLAWPAAMPVEDAGAVQRGKVLYLANCATCHGETGRGEGGKDQRDDDGTPTKPRDFTLGIFKGNREPLPLLHRIQIGMPGTPMPATTHLKANDLADMAFFIRSLAPAEAQAKVEHRRQRLTARRVSNLADAGTRNQASETSVVTSPLWWREWTSPDLQVQALHDGQQLAIRLTWRDATKNAVILQPRDFEDQASVQLFAGAQEPFIGMGAHGFGEVDIWLWKASQSVDQTAGQHQLDEYPFDLPFYRDLLKRLPKATRPVPDFYTGRAAGNPNSATSSGSSASNLAASGPGSTTFRPRNAQAVNATAQHDGKAWSVVFTRPLTVPVAAGTTLTPGKKYFVAFSLWDGAAQERNGQKQISIWHELLVE